MQPHNTTRIHLFCLQQVGLRRNRITVSSTSGNRQGISTAAACESLLCSSCCNQTAVVLWLQYDNRCRISSETALRHPYFLSLGESIHSLADSKWHTHALMHAHRPAHTDTDKQTFLHSSRSSRSPRSWWSLSFHSCLCVLSQRDSTP